MELQSWDDVFLSTSWFSEVERGCIRILRLPENVSVSVIARWCKIVWVGRKLTGVGAYLFYISDMRAGYVLWQFDVDGTLHYREVDIRDSFVDLKLPEGTKWERLAERCDENDLSTQIFF